MFFVMVNQVLVRLWMRLDACLTGGGSNPAASIGENSGALCVLSSKPAMASRAPRLRAGMAPVHGGWTARSKDLERDKGIRWMPWHQEAMKDVARCEKPRGAASRH